MGVAPQDPFVRLLIWSSLQRVVQGSVSLLALSPVPVHPERMAVVVAPEEGPPHTHTHTQTHAHTHLRCRSVCFHRSAEGGWDLSAVPEIFVFCIQVHTRTHTDTQTLTERVRERERERETETDRDRDRDRDRVSESRARTNLAAFPAAHSPAEGCTETARDAPQDDPLLCTFTRHFSGSASLLPVLVVCNCCGCFLMLRTLTNPFTVACPHPLGSRLSLNEVFFG